MSRVHFASCRFVASFCCVVVHIKVDDALASHAATVNRRFSQACCSLILAVGAEALSMTPSGDALFAS